MKIDSSSNVMANSPKQQQASLTEEMAKQVEVEKVEQAVSEAQFDQALQNNQRTQDDNSLPQNKEKENISIEDKTKKVVDQQAIENSSNEKFKMDSVEKGQIVDMMV